MRRRALHASLATFVLSFGTAPVFTLTTDLVISSAPAERAGAATDPTEQERVSPLPRRGKGGIERGLYDRRWTSTAVQPATDPTEPGKGLPVRCRGDGGIERGL
jgi:hypothetical protein